VGGADGASHSLVPGKRGWPQCHANQLVPVTGLVDDAITPHERKVLYVKRESLTYFLARVMVFQQFDDVSLMRQLTCQEPISGTLVEESRFRFPTHFSIPYRSRPPADPQRRLCRSRKGLT